MPDNMLSSIKYNKLPIVGDAGLDGVKYAAACARLCAIIVAHNLQDQISVRLIHKHFDLKENEAMVFRHLLVDGICTAILMGPMSANTPNMVGKHYLLDEETNSIVAYELATTTNAFDVGKHPDFLEEFKNELLRSHVAHVFGIGVQEQDPEMKTKPYTEIELESLRSTLMMPRTLFPAEWQKPDIALATNWVPGKQGQPVPTDDCQPGANGGHTIIGPYCSQSGDHHHIKDGGEFERMLADAESPLSKVVTRALAVAA